MGRVVAGKPLDPALTAEDVEGLRRGCADLAAQVEVARPDDVPVVVAINSYPAGRGERPRPDESRGHLRRQPRLRHPWPLRHDRLRARRTPRFFKAEVMAQAQALLAAEESERRRRVVFMIDEAHLLSPEQLEEIRLLTSAEMDSRTPFALLLVGQPTLVRRLRMGVFAALDQRIATRYADFAPIRSVVFAPIRSVVSEVSDHPPVRPSAR
jgi:hypothetical protein